MMSCVINVLMMIALSVSVDAVISLRSRSARSLSQEEISQLVPDFMKQLYEDMQDDPESDLLWPLSAEDAESPGDGVELWNMGQVDTVHSHSFSDSFLHGDGQHSLAFNLSLNKEDQDALFAAEVRLHRQGLTTHELRSLHPSFQVPHRVDVHEVLHHHPTDPMIRLLDSRPVNISHSGWLSLDVSAMLHRLTSGSDTAGRILVELRTSDGRPSPVSILHVNYPNRVRRDTSSSSIPPGRSPQYITFHRSRGSRRPHRIRHRRKRRKRRRNRGYRGHRGNRRRKMKRNYPHISPDLTKVCQLRKMYVDFTEVGWNTWIIAPAGYNANMCSGRCPYPLVDHYNTTNHAIVQMIMNTVNPLSAPVPCCVPVQLKSKALLHLGQDNEVTYKVYKGMVAVSCGCR